MSLLGNSVFAALIYDPLSLKSQHIQLCMHTLNPKSKLFAIQDYNSGQVILKAEYVLEM